MKCAIGDCLDRATKGERCPLHACNVTKCQEPAVTRKWCFKHRCSIEGCNSKVQARGWCHYHYQRWWNHGDPLYVSKRDMERAGPGAS